MDQAAKTPQPGAVPGGSGRSVAPTNIMPAKPPAPAANSGIKNTGGSYTDIYNAAMDFQRTMARPPSTPGIVADNPYAKGPPPDIMSTPQQQQSTQGSTQAPPPPAAPQPSLPPGAPPNAIPATEETKKFFPNASYSVPDTNSEPSPSDMATPQPPAAPTADPEGQSSQEPGADPVGQSGQYAPEGPVGNNMGLGNWLGRQTAVSTMVNPAMKKMLAREGAEIAANPGMVKATVDPLKNMVTGGGKGWAGRGKAVVDYGKSWLPGLTEGGQAGRASLNAANAAKGGVQGGRVLNALNAVKGVAGLGTAAAALPAAGGFVAGNAALELGDAVGLLPEWAGGTGFAYLPKSMGGAGVDGFGWDQKGFEQQTMDQGYLANMGSGIMNPLKGGTEIFKGLGEGGYALGNMAYNVGTGTSNKDRAATRSIEETQQINNNRAAQLGEQAAQLKAQGDMSYQDQQKYNNLLALADDAKQRASAMEDESANWELGKQNWFGGGHHFQDAMNATGEDLNKQIEEMQGQTLTSAQQANLENLQHRRGEIDRMSKLYDQEAGYWGGTGDFGHSVRNNVTQAKMQLINIGKKMREAQGNPAELARLQSEMQYHNNRLNDYRSWAESANR